MGSLRGGCLQDEQLALQESLGTEDTEEAEATTTEAIVILPQVMARVLLEDQTDTALGPVHTRAGAAERRGVAEADTGRGAIMLVVGLLDWGGCPCGCADLAWVKLRVCIPQKKEIVQRKCKS